MTDDMSKLIKILTANESPPLFLFDDVTALRVCGPCLRPMENRPSSPVFLKVKKFQEMSQPSQNGECTDQRTEKKQQHSSQQQKGTFSDAGGSESEGSRLPPTFPEEDPERTKHSKVTPLLHYSYALIGIKSLDMH